MKQKSLPDSYVHPVGIVCACAPANIIKMRLINVTWQDAILSSIWNSVFFSAISIKIQDIRNIRLLMLHVWSPEVKFGTNTRPTNLQRQCKIKCKTWQENKTYSGQLSTNVKIHNPLTYIIRIKRLKVLKCIIRIFMYKVSIMYNIMDFNW